MFDEEFFTDATLNPGVSVVSTVGYVKTSTGVWWDRPTPGGATTTWSFATPIIAFGANWDLAGPGGQGTGLKMFLNGNLVGSEIPDATAGGFWGVTGDPFDQVLLTTGTQGGSAETYEMDNMVYGQVPVPGAAILGMIGIGMVGAYTRKRRLAHVTQ